MAACGLEIGIVGSNQILTHHGQACEEQVFASRHRKGNVAGAIDLDGGGFNGVGGDAVLGEEYNLVGAGDVCGIDDGDDLGEQCFIGGEVLVSHGTGIDREQIVAAVQRGRQGDVGPAPSLVERHHALRAEAIGVGYLDIGHTTEGGGTHIVAEDAHAEVQTFAGQVELLVGERQRPFGSPARKGAEEETKEKDSLYHGDDNGS